VHIDAPEEVKVQLQPRRGEEQFWPDGGMTSVERSPGSVQRELNAKRDAEEAAARLGSSNNHEVDNADDSDSDAGGDDLHELMMSKDSLTEANSDD